MFEQCAMTWHLANADSDADYNLYVRSVRTLCEQCVTASYTVGWLLQRSCCVRQLNPATPADTATRCRRSLPRAALSRHNSAKGRSLPEKTCAHAHAVSVRPGCAYKNACQARQAVCGGRSEWRLNRLSPKSVGSRVNLATHREYGDGLELGALHVTEAVLGGVKRLGKSEATWVWESQDPGDSRLA